MTKPRNNSTAKKPATRRGPRKAPTEVDGTNLNTTNNSDITAGTTSASIPNGGEVNITGVGPDGAENSVGFIAGTSPSTPKEGDVNITELNPRGASSVPPGFGGDATPRAFITNNPSMGITTPGGGGVMGSRNHAVGNPTVERADSSRDRDLRQDPHFNAYFNNRKETTTMNMPKMQGTTTRDRAAAPDPLDTLLAPPVRAKEMVRAINAGAGRGAMGNLAAIARFNQLSRDREIVPVYVDPAPGKAIGLNREARRHGIRAEFVEARVQDVVTGMDPGDRAPLVLQLDRASDIAKVLRDTEHTKRVTLVYLIMRDPRGRLFGLRAIVRPGDTRARLQLAQFCEELGFVTLARGSSAVVGAEALPEHAAIEPLIRAWFAQHMTQNLAKAAVDIEPDADTVEITTDGEVTQPLILKSSLAWSTPEELAEEVKANFRGAISRGSAFTIAEWVAGEGLRFYQARLRRTDGDFSVQGATVVNPSEFQRADLARAEAAEMRRRQAEAVTALARAAQTAFTRTNPVATTD